MTISKTHCRKEYTGNGATLVFPYDFYIGAAVELLVYVAGVMKTLGVDHTVSGAGGTEAGGNVTFLSGSIPANGALVVILRSTAQMQATDLAAGGKFYESDVEAMSDKVTRLIQELQEALGRTLKLSTTSQVDGLTIPDPVPGGLLKWKADLSGMENYVAAFPGGNPGDNFDWGTGPPIAGAWTKPWIRFNVDHQLGEAFAWVLVTDGSPGVWAEVGFVSANPA